MRLGGESELIHYAHGHLDPYHKFGHVQELDERAGLPNEAGTCDAHALLKEIVLGQLAAGPGPFLREEEDMPRPLKRPFVKIGCGYAEVVKRAVACGLQRWVRRRFVKHARGKPIVSGVFAVAKTDSAETRMISAAMPANQCLDMSKVPTPRFLELSMLGILAPAGRGRRLVISKRDVRHFYQMLAATAQWQRLLAHQPPLDGRPLGRRTASAAQLPVHCSWPMGFAPSATIAQGVAELD